MSLPNRKLLLPIVTLLVMATFLGMATNILTVHAQTCTDIGGTPPCPQLSIVPASQTVPAPGGTLTLLVNFTNMPSFNAWDISIKTDNAVLNPTSITLVETFGNTAAQFSNC